MIHPSVCIAGLGELFDDFSKKLCLAYGSVWVSPKWMQNRMAIANLAAKELPQYEPLIRSGRQWLVIQGRVTGNAENLTKKGVLAMATTMSTASKEGSVPLTDREAEVLNRVLEGRSSKEVARLLFVSKRTIDFHLTNIYHKLHVSNRVQAVLRAAQMGLLEPIPEVFQ